jgi:glutamate racemase
MSNASIGIFDSGFGGLTVMRAIKKILPKENIVYFGDTARLPYGDKSAETIQKFSFENVKFLKNHGVKLIVVACSTACSAALELLTESFDIPIIGMIDPAVDYLHGKIKEDAILVLGTRRTILSGVYQRKIDQEFPKNETIPIACPLFVPLVEEGFFDHPIAELTAREYLAEQLKIKIDVALLACTHYPLLSPILQKIFEKDTLLIDPGESCAKHVAQLLKKKDLLNRSGREPNYQFFVSDDPEKFKKIGQIFLNSSMPDVELISLSEYTHTCQK